MSENRIILKSVTKSYATDAGRLTVLRKVDLSVRPGSIVSVTGPSGSGKSTLLHLIGALDRPDSGEIHIGGRNITALAGNELASYRSREVGFLFQFHHLMTEFTAEENVMMPLLISGTGFKKAMKTARETLTAMGLEDRIMHLPAKLSGGDQQRTALARALVTRPALLLADEPTGNLDADNGAMVMDLLRESVQRFGASVILATHDMQLASIASESYRLQQGTLI